VKWRLH